MMLKFRNLVVTAALSTAITFSSLPLAQATEWGYEGEIGPEFWGGLSPDYVLCSEGQGQSPININSGFTTEAELKKLRTRYDSAALNVQNNGHTIQVNMAPGSNIKTPNGRYSLLQFHFHFESEHTVDDTHAPLEAHFVHMNNDGELVVLGVFISESHENSKNKALEIILVNAPHDIAINELDVELELEDLLPDTEVEDYWHYNGSLTTPPCSQGVKWYVAKKHIHASVEQIEAMAALVHDNNYRPTQPLNGRVINDVTD